MLFRNFTPLTINVTSVDREQQVQVVDKWELQSHLPHRLSQLATISPSCYDLVEGTVETEDVRLGVVEKVDKRLDERLLAPLASIWIGTQFPPG